MADDTRMGATEPNLLSMWLRVLDASWSVLAVVPVTEGASVRGIVSPLLQDARGLAAGDVRFVDATGATAADGGRISETVALATSAGARVILATDPPRASDTAISLVHRADAAMLVVQLGRCTDEEVRLAREALRADALLGCVALHPAYGALPPDAVPSRSDAASLDAADGEDEYGTAAARQRA